MRTIGELLIALKGAKTDDEKVELITSNKNLPKLTQYVELLTNPDLEFWNLPDGVSYKTRDHVLGRTTTLMSSYKTFGYMQLPTRVREDRLRDMYVGMMDVLHVSEAELAACIVERKELPFVSNKILREALGLDPMKEVQTPEKAAKQKEEVAEKEAEDVGKEFNVVVTEDVPVVEEEILPQIKFDKKPTVVEVKETPKPKVKPKSKSTPKKTPRKTTKKK